MFNIIPFVLIIISLAIIMVIISRKFAVLANLDLDTIQAEREAKFKEQIIGTRFKRSFYKHQARLSRSLMPAIEAVRNLFRWLYKKLSEYREEYKREKIVKREEGSSNMIKRLFSEAEDLLKNDNLEAAEKKFIEIIGFDSKNIEAFKNLGEIYFEKKNYNEARETFGHVLRLTEKEIGEIEMEGGAEDKESVNELLASVYFDLALLEKESANFEESIKNIDSALKIRSNSPRFLDTKVGISIIKKDKTLALEAYNKLAEVNPENQKLDELKKQIDEISV